MFIRWHAYKYRPVEYAGDRPCIAILTMVYSRFRRIKRRLGTKVAKLYRSRNAASEASPKDRTAQDLDVRERRNAHNRRWRTCRRAGIGSDYR